MTNDAPLPVWSYYQPWDHGPIWAVTPGRTQAQCMKCGWVGPDRTGDPHAARLVDSDVHWHLDVVGADL